MLKQEYTIVSNEVTELSNQLMTLSEQLESNKEKMDEIGSGMTDAKPLVNIKQAVTKLKTDIKQMDLRIRVIETSLVHRKLKTKRHYLFAGSEMTSSRLDLYAQQQAV